MVTTIREKLEAVLNKHCIHDTCNRKDCDGFKHLVDDFAALYEPCKHEILTRAVVKHNPELHDALALWHQAPPGLQGAK